jgi:zinc transport system substrate-binding protein
MKNLYLIFCFVLMVAIIGGCSEQQSTPQTPGKLIVFTGLPPISSIAEAIGGEAIVVKTLLPAGQSPHSFTPHPSLIRELGQAKLYISVDMPFEQNIILPVLKQKSIMVCAADLGIKKLSIGEHHHDHATEGEEHAAHHHDQANEAKHTEHQANSLGGSAKKANKHKEHIEADDDHHHAAPAHPDPHIWLSTTNDLIIAKNITTALSQVDPDHAETYRRNLATFSQKINKVKIKLEQLLLPFKGRTLYVYHPAFGYFAAEFGLQQQAVEHEGKQPTPKELAGLIKNAKHDKVKFIFVQPRFSERSADIIAKQVGAKVIRLDPLSHDLLGNYLKIADSIKQALASKE